MFNKTSTTESESAKSVEEYQRMIEEKNNKQKVNIHTKRVKHQKRKKKKIIHATPV